MMILIVCNKSYLADYDGGFREEEEIIELPCISHEKERKYPSSASRGIKLLHRDVTVNCVCGLS